MHWLVFSSIISEQTLKMPTLNLLNLIELFLPIFQKIFSIPFWCELRLVLFGAWPAPFLLLDNVLL